MRFIDDISNVKRFMEGIGVLESRSHKSPGFALVYGLAGLGKTETVIWHSAKTGSPMLRAKKAWTVSWMFREICESLGLYPDKGIANMYGQIKKSLLNKPTTLYIDELDHVVSNAQLIESLRDIHDETRCGIVLIGMEKSNVKLNRYDAMMSRIAVKINFKDLTKKDTNTVVKDCFPKVEVTDDSERAIINEIKGNFRLLDALIAKLKILDRINPLSVVDAKTVQKAAKMKGKDDDN